MRGSWDAERDPLAALQRGDAQPFEKFVQSEAPTFFGFFIRLGVPRPEAEDLTQDVFVKLFQSAPAYTPRATFPAFAWRVARNVWIDRRRRRQARAEELFLDGPELDAPSLDELSVFELPPEDGLDRRETTQRLLAALATLPEPHRWVFELAVIQERPYEEIGELLGIPIGTVKSRVFHALRKLRARLGGADA